jgi:hypothetical protein
MRSVVIIPTTLSSLLPFSIRQQVKIMPKVQSHKRQTARRISKLHGRNKSSVKDMLGDCK